MSKDTGVLFALEYDGKGGSCQHEPGAPASGPLWMHLDFSSRGARHVLEAEGLESYVIDTLTRLESRPHAISVDGGLMVILRGINRNAGADPEDMVSIRIWVDTSRLLTVRQRPVRAVTDVRLALEAGKGPSSIPETLIDIIRRTADGVALFVEDIEERMELLEQRVDADERSSVRSELSAVRRQVAAVRRYLAPQRDALESLHRLAARLLDAEQVFDMREQSDRMTRYIEDLDLVRERALVAQEELMNLVAQEQNNRTYLFTVVATVFLPITFISGVFGMNTGGLPGLEDPRAFWLVGGAMTAVALAVVVWLRLKKWM